LFNFQLRTSHQVYYNSTPGGGLFRLTYSFEGKEVPMASLKRQLANLIERLSGNMVIPPHELHRLPERVLLKKFFSHFGVDCVFDVGANVGQYATRIRDEVGFRGPIISFEPIPELADQMRTAARTIDNWYIEALALDREAGPKMFHVMQASTFSSLRLPAEDQPAMFSRSNAVALEIPVMRSTLAAELTKWQAKLGFNRPFLKMDTQGNDVAVVEGAGDLIQSFVGLQSELAIRTLYAGAANYVEAIQAYSSRGFELTALVPNTEGHFPRLIEIDCIMYRRDALPAHAST
jgi:FkbM family methyltransferase